MSNEGIPRPLRKKIIGHKTDSMDERYGIVDIDDSKAVREIMGRKLGIENRNASQEKAAVSLNSDSNNRGRKGLLCIGGIAPLNDSLHAG